MASVRRVDQHGRVVVASDARKKLGLGPQSQVEIFTDGDRVILRKYKDESMENQLRSLLSLYTKDEILKALSILSKK